MIDSSPSSAESNFRELDEVFLQTQTRIWLGELLNTRLNEELHISDLLQDGEILFEVSKILWDLLLTKCMELRHLKNKYGPFGSKRSSGRYKPYSNVDSFLKICKILGLSGIDLFSPSDVVEKRDVRKVCICIRALSKKARSKQLSVPDFDMVRYSVTMPTDMVGVIRRSIESSQCTFSSTSSYSSRKGSLMKLKQKNLYARSNRDYDSSSSDESDEAESRYMGESSFSPACKFDYTDGVNSDSENSPETCTISGQYRNQNVVESDVKCRCTEDFKQEQCKSASLSEAIQSFSSHEFGKNSCHSISKKKLYHGISHVNGEERGAADNSNIIFTLENDDSVMGDSSFIGVGESNYISNYLAFSDLMVHTTTDGSNSVVLDGESNMFDFFLNVESQGVMTSDKIRSFDNGSQRVLSDDEDMEVSSTTSMSSVLGRLLNLEFDEDDLSSANVHSSASNEHESDRHFNDSFVLPEPRKEDDTFEMQSRTVLFDSQEAQSETITDNDPCLPVEDMNKAQYNISSAAENCSQDKRERSQDSSGESISDGREDTRPRLPPVKHNRRPLLKTVIKGTAIAGVLFLLLHISRKNERNNAQETRQNSRISKYSGSKSSSSRKQHKGSAEKGIYPVEKLKLGN